MKIEFAIDPVIRAVPVNDLDIRVHGCVGVQLMFMLRPSPESTQEQMVELTKAMMVAAVAAFDQFNKEINERTPPAQEPPIPTLFS